MYVSNQQQTANITGESSIAMKNACKMKKQFATVYCIWWYLSSVDLSCKKNTLCQRFLLAFLWKKIITKNDFFSFVSCVHRKKVVRNSICIRVWMFTIEFRLQQKSLSSISITKDKQKLYIKICIYCLFRLSLHRQWQRAQNPFAIVFAFLSSFRRNRTNFK